MTKSLHDVSFAEYCEVIGTIFILNNFQNNNKLLSVKEVTEKALSKFNCDLKDLILNSKSDKNKLEDLNVNLCMTKFSILQFIEKGMLVKFDATDDVFVTDDKWFVDNDRYKLSNGALSFIESKNFKDIQYKRQKLKDRLNNKVLTKEEFEVENNKLWEIMKEKMKMYF